MSDTPDDATSDALANAASDASDDATSDDVRHIENPPEIVWGDSRSLLLTIRYIQRVLRSDPELAEDLLGVAYMDARQIIEDADETVRSVRGRPSALRKAIGNLADSIEGELEGDAAADEAQAAEASDAM